MDVQLGADALGSFALMRVDARIYPPHVVMKAAYWLTDRCYLHLSMCDENTVAAELRERDGKPCDVKALCGELSNKLIDFAVRERVDRETQGIREQLLRKAFWEGIPHPGLDNVSSGESRLIEEAGGHHGGTHKDDD